MRKENSSIEFYWKMRVFLSVEFLLVSAEQSQRSNFAHSISLLLFRFFYKNDSLFNYIKSN